ncbi:DUF29 domain-containing protein [Acaryochloris sp. CCMEE 5410]|uniref:DUF29 domain-containing protein n=1 Tax=Acaryochloris sp. CCMEE 5410 TaxID=310037 RepID=UPI00024837E2|nr:DUF29 domain-containing protein [Acaryochloris sp. CCMEE 5410]KAI9133229.1 DUF29 domain-containing protein [Acaryochloris sp. CCMEE 5410]
MTSTQLPNSEQSSDNHRPIRNDGLVHQQLYETDFVEWINQAVVLLKQSKFSELDLENLIEEVESWGRSEKNVLRSNLRILLLHLLKWQYQPGKQSGSWRRSIREHRIRIQEAFTDSPSLKNYYIDSFGESYRKARQLAADETGLGISTFPTESPYTPEQVLESEFLPEVQGISA